MSTPEWRTDPNDSRYEEKYIERDDGGIIRLTRERGQKTEYPHTTEQYKNGKKVKYNDSDRWDAHKSKQSGSHSGVHRVPDDYGSSSGGK